VQNRRKIGIIIFPIIALVLCGLISCNKNEELFKTKNIKPIVLRPRDVFRNNPTFFVLNRVIIDFSENDNQFRWDLPKGISGYLHVQIVLYKAINQIPATLPHSCSFSVLLQNGGKEKAKLEEKFSPEDFTRRNKYFSLVKGFRIPLDLEEGHAVRFQIDIPEDYDNSGLKYGITVPYVENLAREKCQESDIPNLIIISIDTLRADYLGVYKDFENQPFDFSYSPNLDLFAEQAVVFRKAYTPLSATWPALASMYTSLYPCEHGVLYNRQELRFYFDTIATHMLNMGYCTLSLHGNCFGLNISGFDEKYLYDQDDIALIESALQMLRRDSNQPFFHWYHLLGVHANYKPPKWVMTILAKDEPYRFYNLGSIMRGGRDIESQELEYIRMLYAGELFNLDFELNKIFAFLKRNNLWEKTMVIVTSDHGEDLYQHHQNFFHYPSLYDTALRIPLMIKFPNQKKKVVIEEPVTLLDIFPTIVDYLRSQEAGKEQDYEFSGLSLLPLLRGNKKLFQNRNIFAGVEDFDIIAVVEDDWKLIYNPEKKTILNQVDVPYPYEEFELYQTNEDVLEVNNVFQENLEFVRELIKKIERFKKIHKKLKKLKKGLPTKTTKEFKAETIEHLRALGYIK